MLMSDRPTSVSDLSTRYIQTNELAILVSGPNPYYRVTKIDVNSLYILTVGGYLVAETRIQLTKFRTELNRLDMQRSRAGSRRI